MVFVADLLAGAARVEERRRARGRERVVKCIVGKDAGGSF